MQDVWFGPGLTRGDFDGFLQALSLQDKGNAPLLAVATGGEDARLVIASRALFALFGVTSGEALSDRLLRGRDPGAKRLVSLFRTLPLDGAPRLERLRFFLGPGSEIITFLCRRVTTADGKPVFIAAALGVRAGLIPAIENHSQAAATASEVAPPSIATPPQAQPHSSMSVQDIQATLRRRWPTSRTVRFLWQTDANAICILVTPPLEDIVGRPNGDLVNRNVLDLAPAIDPSGRLAKALASQTTWSGLDVAWPISDASAGVAVGLGAIPAFDRERTFEGYRGYGVIHLDRIGPRDAVRFPAHPTEAPEPPPPTGNVVPFPGGKALSAEDQLAFDALGAELRDQAGLNEPKVKPQAEVKTQVEVKPEVEPPVVPEAIASAVPLAALSVAPLVSAPPAVPEPPAEPEPSAKSETPAAPEPHAEPEPQAKPSATPGALRADDIARNGLAMIDRLAIGLLVSRDNVPIFANRHLLDMLGFADEDALHEAGGMTHLFGGQPGNVTGSESVGVRDRQGVIIPTHARMQRVDWDGLPATLLTLQPAAPPPWPLVEPIAAEPLVADPLPVDPKVVDPAPVDPVTVAAETEPPHSEVRELRAILETATDGVAVIDANGNVRSLNRSGEALFGCDRGTVIGKPFLSLFAPHNQDLAADYLEGLKSNATKSLLNDGRELLIQAQQGGTIPVFMTLGRLGSPAAEPDGARFCALFRDLTHWKKVEGELETAKRDAERASALKSDFLAKVSHEVRTPLNAIIGFAEVIMEERFGPVGNDRYKDYLRDIHASGTHVMSLINDLLDLSKIEAGKMELTVAAVDANKIITECVSLMQPQANRERVIMRLSLAAALPRIKADERSLRQIVLNLLSNAVKFNEPGGQVIVATTTTEDGKVVIRIRDTGPGMSETDIAAALEPFRQLSTSRQTSGGTGLGLPLTKALVEANEASFTIRSKLEQGTLVEVAFPPARVLAS